MTGRLGDTETIAMGLPPTGDRVSSFRFVASLPRFRTRRETGTAIYRAVETTNLHGDLQELRSRPTQAFSFVSERGNSLKNDAAYRTNEARGALGCNVDDDLNASWLFVAGVLGIDRASQHFSTTSVADTVMRVSAGLASGSSWPIADACPPTSRLERRAEPRGGVAHARYRLQQLIEREPRQWC